MTATTAKKLKVLVACEFSGAIRDKLIELGHDAYSCDLLPAEGKYVDRHYQEDVERLLLGGWDMMIAHPPCTHLAVSGARWFKDKKAEQQEALGFVSMLMDAPIQHIAIENPISIISSKIRKPDQIIQPWMFGHYETKATCLWTKNLPELKPLYQTPEECRIAMSIPVGVKPEARIHKMPPSKDRGKLRSVTFSGIAEAMAVQWTDWAVANGNN